MVSKIEKEFYLDSWIESIPNRQWDSADAINKGYIRRLSDAIAVLSKDGDAYARLKPAISDEIKRGWKGNLSNKELAFKLWRGVSFQHNISGLIKGDRHIFDDILKNSTREVVLIDSGQLKKAPHFDRDVEENLLQEYKVKLLESIEDNLSHVLPVVLIKHAVNDYVNTMYKEHKVREEYRVLVESNRLTRREKAQYLKENIDGLSSSWDKLLGSEGVVVEFRGKSLEFIAKNLLMIPAVPISVGLISPALGGVVLSVMMGIIIAQVAKLGFDVASSTLGEGFSQKITNLKEVAIETKNRIGYTLKLTKDEPGKLWNIMTKDNSVALGVKKSKSSMPVYERIVLNDAKRLELKKSKRLAEVANRAFGGGDTLSGIEEEIERRIKESVVVDDDTIASEKEFSEKIGGALSKLKAMNSKVDKGSKIT